MEDLIKGACVMFAIILGIALVVFIVALAIGAIIIVAPPMGLSALLRNRLQHRYELSPRKKWQCAGLAAGSFSLPFLLLFADSSPVILFVAAWTGVILGLSVVVVFLALSAYRQHIATHKRSIRKARVLLAVECIRHGVASIKLWKVNLILAHVERGNGRLLRSRENLAARIETLVESNDPALFRIKLDHWKAKYSGISEKALSDELVIATRRLALTTADRKAPEALHALSLELHLVRRKLAGTYFAARADAFGKSREDLRLTVGKHAEIITACKSVLRTEMLTLNQLNKQRLALQ